MREQHSPIQTVASRRSRASRTDEALHSPDGAGHVRDTQRVPFHRAGHSSRIHPEDEPYWTDQHKPSRPSVDRAETLDYQEEPLRSRTSAIRYDRPPLKRTARRDDPKQTRRIQERRLDRYTLMIIVSVLIIVMVGGWWLLSTVSTWWMSWQDDLHYGNPRTYQIDQFVGQGDSPEHPDHFIVVNTHGQVFVIQINPLNSKLDQIYGITTASDPKVLVSLSFRPTGKTWAMYVVVGDTTPYTVEYVSNGKQFVPASH